MYQSVVNGADVNGLHSTSSAASLVSDTHDIVLETCKGSITYDRMSRLCKLSALVSHVDTEVCSMNWALSIHSSAAIIYPIAFCGSFGRH